MDLSLRESEVVRSVLSFLESRGLVRALDALERESGLLARPLTAPAAELRSMVVAGKWAEAAAALRHLPDEDRNSALFLIMRQKYLELICVYEELGNELCDDVGNAIALCFSELSTYCPDPEEREQLRRLARLSRLSQDPQYRNWDPLSARRRCFEALCPLIGVREDPGPEPGRLTELLAKGLLYEACEEHFHRRKNDIWEDQFKKQGHSGEDHPMGEDLSSDDHFNKKDKLGKDHFKRKDIDQGKDEGSFRFGSLLATGPRTTELYSWLRGEGPLRVLVEPLSGASGVEEGWTETILMHSGTGRERFWNRRIEDVLVDDAPEILKRAEDVIGRWEARNRNRAEFREDTRGIMERDVGNRVASKEEDSRKHFREGPEQSSNIEIRNRAVLPANYRPSIEREAVLWNMPNEDGDSSKEDSNQGPEPSSEKKECSSEDKQNVRDLLAAKDRVRDKLLQILNTDEMSKQH